VVALSFDILVRGLDAARRGLRGLGDDADEAGDRFDRMGAAIATGAAAAGVTAGGLLAKGFADNLDLEAGRAKLGAQLGLTATKSEEVGKIAGKLYAGNYGESMEEVNEAIGGVIQNIDGMRDASAATLESITAKVLNLSTTTGETSTAISASISQMLRTGLAKNADEAMDILTVGFQQGVNKSEDLLDTFTEYGTQFRKMGIDGKQATGLMSQGLKAGARDADTVADALKEFSLIAVDHGSKAGHAWKKLGLDTKKMRADVAAGGTKANKALDETLDRLRKVEDPVKRSALAVELFGTKAEDMGDALFALDPSTAVKGLGDVAGAADKMDKTLGETGQARVEKMKRGFEQWTQKMAGSEGALGDVTGSVMAFGGPALAMAGQAGMLVAGLAAMNTGSLLTAASTAAGTAATIIWSAVTKGAGLVAAGFSLALRGVGMAMTFALGPVGLIIVAIAAAAAGLIYAYKHSEKFRAIVDGSMKAVGKAVSFMWNSIMKPVFRFIVKTWLEVAGSIVHGAAKAFGWMPGLGPKLKKAAGEFDKFKDKVNRSLDNIHDEKANITLSMRNNIPKTLYGIRIGGGQGSWRGGITMATGGAVFGGGTETSDSIPAYLSRGEHVLTAKEVRGFGGHGAVESMRKSARGYATGGPIALTGMNNALASAARVSARVSAKVIQNTAERAIGYNPSLSGALNFARNKMVGTPYIWGGVGPRGWDCSGAMSSLLNVLQGKNPYSRRFATGSFPSAGFVPGPGSFMIGSRRGNPGHMAGTINGINVESSGGRGFRMGRSARGARDSMFTGLYHLRGYADGGPVGDAPYDLLNPAGREFVGYSLRKSLLFDKGGLLASGGTAVNRSGQPERVLSGAQTQSFDRLVRVIGRRPDAVGGAGPAIDYTKLADAVSRSIAKAGLSVRLDGRAVGVVMGTSASVLGRAG
jgi:phage-related minor tail protein